MAELLLDILNRTNRKKLEDSIHALEYFRKNAEFVFPLDRRDFWATEKMGLSLPEAKRDEMEALYRAELLRREKVSAIVPYAGDVMIYELNEQGEKIFEKIFHEKPKMCVETHYAKPG
ncbi:hypothetical protein A3K64_01350 [Candidatus Micrarchaeota archaeon RBG_16_36_9]|nr:MAG: hypothetical protein A3K64_01350 [Candidatus Micrarchaeota archaeon RBG_16_36_9]